jgi:hypothetical protein
MTAMKQNYLFLLLSGWLLFSCSHPKNGQLPEIPVDIDQNISLPLSEITEDIKAIELEMTDESLVNPDRIKRVFLCDGNVIVAERDRIFLFREDGKFVRPVGSKGQGPGEYLMVRNLALDEKNRRLFVNGSSKIIGYDLDGNFLTESFKTQRDGGLIIDMNYIHDELWVLVEYIGRKDDRGSFNHSILYRLDDNFQIADSCAIRDTYFERPGFYTHKYEDFILPGNSKVYLYYPDLYFQNEQQPAEVVLRDTLYSVEKNRPVPELKLKFRNDGIDGSGNKFIQLMNIYRSSRYVFAAYGNALNNNYYQFCHDMKTGKGYSMQDGYTDDIHGIEERVTIFPLGTEPELFYYWHTHFKPDATEEPNPVLYIGRLKK